MCKLVYANAMDALTTGLQAKVRPQTLILQILCTITTSQTLATAHGLGITPNSFDAALVTSAETTFTTDLCSLTARRGVLAFLLLTGEKWKQPARTGDTSDLLQGKCVAVVSPLLVISALAGTRLSTSRRLVPY